MSEDEICCSLWLGWAILADDRVGVRMAGADDTMDVARRELLCLAPPLALEAFDLAVEGDSLKLLTRAFFFGGSLDLKLNFKKII